MAVARAVHGRSTATPRRAAGRDPTVPGIPRRSPYTGVIPQRPLLTRVPRSGLAVVTPRAVSVDVLLKEYWYT